MGVFGGLIGKRASPLVLATLLSVEAASLFGSEVPSPKKALVPADSLYEQQRFTEAYALYEKIDRTGQSSVRMLLRMAYVKEGLGQTAEALALLNRSYYKSYDPVIRQKIEALAAEQNLSGYDFSEAEPLFLFLTQHSQALKWIIITGLILLSIGLYLGKRHQKDFTLALFVLFTLLSTLGVVLVTKPWQQVSYGIVTQDQAWLKKASSAAAPREGTLPYGTRVKLLAQDSVWSKIEVNEKKYAIRRKSLLFLGASAISHFSLVLK